MPRWLKTVVVSVVEKAYEMHQVGVGKTVRSPCFGDRFGTPVELILEMVTTKWAEIAPLIDVITARIQTPGTDTLRRSAAAANQ